MQRRSDASVRVDNDDRLRHDDLVCGEHSDDDTSGFAALVAPSPRASPTIATPPADVMGDAGNGAAWIDDRAIFWAGNSPAGPAAGALYDPEHNTWKRLPGGPLGAREGYASVWTGRSRRLVLRPGPPDAGVVIDDPAAGTWRTGRPPPCPVPDPYYTQTAWIGNRYVKACGTDDLQIYSPATDTWQTIKPGASPLNSRAGSTIVWTGTELIAWSGSVEQPMNPTPNDGTSIVLGG